MSSYLSLVCKALAAVYRTVIPGLERNLAGFSAGSADSVEHFTRGSASIFAGVAAGLAALGLIGEAFFFKEILLTCRENKFLATVFAYQCFVLMHQLKYLVFKIYTCLFYQAL